MQQILDYIAEWFPMSPGQQHDNGNENKRKYTNKISAFHGPVMTVCPELRNVINSIFYVNGTVKREPLF